MGDIVSGGSGTNGLVTVNGTDGLPLVQLIASDTEAKIGAGQRNGRPGHLQMYDGSGQLTVDLNTADATLTLGGSNTDGTVTVSGTDGQPLIQLMGSATESRIGMGQRNGRPGHIQMYDGNGNLTIDINATGGDIALNGDLTLAAADCAEQFDMQDASSAEPGTIVVIDDEGKLRESQCAYDKRVAGVISGAGDYRPG